MRKQTHARSAVAPRSPRNKARQQKAAPAEKALKRAVFFDRDGVLNEEVGYVNHLARFWLYPFAGQAVKAVNDAGLLAFVVTNQSGVARGLFTEALVKRVHSRLRRSIREEGARLDGIFYCPHHPQARMEEFRMECGCRKPLPGMLLQAAETFGIDLAQSFVIGDRYVDIAMARQAGSRSVLVRTGYGQGEWEHQRNTWDYQPDFVAANALDAARWILRNL